MNLDIAVCVKTLICNRPHQIKVNISQCTNIIYYNSRIPMCPMSEHTER
uniref:Uncharacterized protein n=1 Tax=Anguilla anguilla TaxID=7936 RepID=A0A0E9TUI7_ANGAN